MDFKSRKLKGSVNDTILLASIGVIGGCLRFLLDKKYSLSYLIMRCITGGFFGAMAGLIAHYSIEQPEVICGISGICGVLGTDVIEFIRNFISAKYPSATQQIEDNIDFTFNPDNNDDGVNYNGH